MYSKDDSFNHGQFFINNVDLRLVIVMKYDFLVSESLLNMS